MPAPALAVDWEAIKAHAITHGVRQAARAFGLSQSTVKSRCTREKWLENCGKVVQALPKTMQLKASNASTASEAALKTKENVAKRTHFLLSKATLKGAQGMASKDANDIQNAVDVLLKLTQTADKLHGYSHSRDKSVGGMINIAISGIAPVIDVEHVASAPVIDVEH